MTTIDRSLHLPLHFQLRQVLLARLEGGEWKPGDLIPTEHELQAKYGLSRTTVRQTLSELVFEGRLVRYRGRGTFVAGDKFAHSPNRQGLTHKLEEQGVRPGWQLLDERTVTAPPAVREALRLNGRTLRYLSHLPQLAESRAHRTIEAVAATEADARWLEVEPGTPILQIERLVTAADGSPLEYLQARYRGDRFKYQITL